MICSNCGAQFPDTDQVCWQCGKPVNQGGNMPYNNMPYNNANQMNPQQMYNQPNPQSMYNQPNPQQMYNQPNQQQMYNQMNPQPMYNQNYQAPKQGGGPKTIILVLSLVVVVGIVLGLAIWMLTRPKKGEGSTEQARNTVTEKTEGSTTEKTEGSTTESGNPFGDEKINSYTMGSMTYYVPDRYLGDGKPNEEGYVYFYYEDVMVMVSKEAKTVDINNQVMQDSLVEGFFSELGEPSDVEKFRDIKVAGQDAFEFTGKVNYAGDDIYINAYIIQCGDTWYEVVAKDNLNLDNMADFDNIIDTIEFSE